MGKFSGKIGKAIKSYTEGKAVLLINGIDDINTGKQSALKNLEAGSYLHGYVDVYTRYLPPNPTALIKFLLKGKFLEHGFKTDSENNVTIENEKEKWLKEKTKFVVAPLQPCPMVAPGKDGMYILRYPISYQLNDTLCDSFSIDRHNNQFCKYELKVKVKYHGFHVKVKSNNRDVDIMGRRPTYEQLTTAPPMKKDDKNSLFGGEIEAEARCDAYCYMEGQVINITANVHNKTSSMLQSAEITLVEKCCYPNVNRDTKSVQMVKNKIELVSTPCS